jgi:hypothetical protein
MKKGLVFYVLPLVFCFVACGEKQGSEKNANAISKDSSGIAEIDSDYQAFRGYFLPTSLPIRFGEGLETELECFELPTNLQMKFLHHSNETTKGCALVDLSSEFDCLVTDEHPLEGVHYWVLNVFSKDGKLVDEKEIGGDDGTDAYEGYLKEDKTLRVHESLSGSGGWKNGKDHFYQISSSGEIAEIKSQRNFVNPDYERFRNSFREFDLPYIVNTYLDPPIEPLSDVLQTAFLNIREYSIKPYGRFDFSSEFDCYVTIENLSSDVHYLVLNVFTLEGKLTSRLTVSGHDVNVYEGSLSTREHNRIRVSKHSSNSMEGTETVYQINADGKIVEVDE